MFKKGDVVVVTDEKRRPVANWPVGTIAVVEQNQRDDMVLVRRQADGLINNRLADRFKLYEEEEKPAKKAAKKKAPKGKEVRPLKEGDEIIIMCLDKRSSNYMKEYVGKTYSVHSVKQNTHGEQIVYPRGADGYYWLISSVQRVDGYPHLADQGAIIKAKKAKVKKPKKLKDFSLRVALHNKQPSDNNPTCYFGFKLVDNSFAFYANAPCHAGLGYTAGPKVVKELAYGIRKECGNHKKKLSDDYKNYVKYIIQESPWADCFLTQNVVVALRYDLLMNVTKHRHQIAAACIALREGTELRGRLPLFNEVLKKGFSGHVAYIMAALFCRDGGKKLNSSVINGAHMVLNNSMGYDDMMKFFANGYDVKKVPVDQPYSTHHGAYVVGGAISHNGKDSMQNKIHNLVGKKEGEGFYANYKCDEDAFWKTCQQIEDDIKKAKVKA